MSDGQCIYECGKDVDEQTGFRQVVAWERIKRGASGTKGLVAPKHLDRYACPDCVRKLTRGIDPRQESLL